MDKTSRDSLPIIPPNWNPEQNYGCPKTYSYFETDEVVSAVQKSVRRCLPETYQWFFELFLGGKTGRDRVWKRALVIAVEDIGPANPEAIIRVWALSKHYRNDLRGAYEACRVLVESPKSRINDNAAIFLKAKNPKTSYLIVDLKGKLMNGLQQNDIISMLTAAGAIHRQTGNTDIIWEIILQFAPTPYFLALHEISRGGPFKSSEGKLCWIHAIHLIWARINPQLPQLEQPTGNDNAILALVERRNPFCDGSLVGMPDFAVDKHTLRGKHMGRGTNHFATVGSLLNNEHESWKSYSANYLIMSFGRLIT